MMPQKVWKIRTEAAKDDRGCERTFKAGGLGGCLEGPKGVCLPNDTSVF